MNTSPVETKFSYQKSSEKKKQIDVRLAKRTRLFEGDSNSSDEDSKEVCKKVKIEPKINYSQVILKSYQMKEYTKCLETVDEFFTSSSKSQKSFSHFRIIQAACWIMTNANKEKVLETLNEIINTEPTNSFAVYCLGLAQYRSGEFMKSINSFGKAVDLNPSSSMKIAMECQAKAKWLMELLEDGKIISSMSIRASMFKHFISFLYS
jgi:tetratricopeptide (TPR) repeat protein